MLKYIKGKWRLYRSVSETLLSSLNQSIPKIREAPINQLLSGQAAHLMEYELVEKLQGLQLKALRDSQTCIGWFHASIIKLYIEVLDKSYHQIIRRINDNYMSDPSLKTFAMEADVSASQLSKAFRQMTGSNYIHYLTPVKMSHCKQLLVTTDMKISEIATHTKLDSTWGIRLDVLFFVLAA